MRFGIKTKLELLLVGFALILCCIAGVALTSLQRRIVSQSVTQDVERGRRVLEEVIQKRSVDLTTAVTLVADLPTIKSVLVYSHPDPATVHQRLLAYTPNLKTNCFVVTDDAGHLVTSEGEIWKGLKSPSAITGLNQALDGKTWSGVLTRNGELLFGVSAPVTVAGYVKGTISVFEPIDNSTATEISHDLDLDVAFLSGGKVVGTSIPSIDRKSTAEISRGNQIEWMTGGKRLVGSTSSFPGANSADGISLVILRNYDDLAAPFKETQRDLALILIGILGFATILARLISKRVVRRLEALVRSAKVLQLGGWPAPIESVKPDEIGMVQNAFNDMVSSLQKSQKMLLGRTEDLREALQRAESSTKARTEFLATISHELRTPLNGIVGMGDLLADSDLTLQQQENVRTIVASSESLLTIVNDVLSYSELESGKANLELQETDMAALVRGVVEESREAAHRKGLSLKINLPEDADDYHLTDAIKVRQVLENLLSNAIKFTNTGSIDVRLTLNEKRTEISVSDTGPGIDEEHRELIREPFSQVDGGRTRKAGGSGLGLSICHHIATLLGGSLTMESVVGMGSTFTFSFPSRRLNAGLVAAPSIIGAPFKIKVLVVDDNDVNLKVATKILTRMGAEVVAVSSGTEAIATFSPRFDLVLMDCHMPEVDGFEATVKIREKETDSRRSKIVALTASNLEEDRLRSYECGMDAFLVKPLRSQAILDLWVALEQKKAA